MPRCPDSHLTLIGWDGSQGQRSLFTCCSFHPHYLLRLIPSPSNVVSMKGFSILLKGNTRLCSFCAGAQDGGRRLGLMFYRRGAFLFSKNNLTAVPQLQSGALGLVWSHLTAGKIKHKHRPAALCRAPFQHPAMIKSVAETWPQTSTSSHSEVFFQALVWHSPLFPFRIGRRVRSWAHFSTELPLELQDNDYHNNYSDSPFLKCTWFIWLAKINESPNRANWDVQHHPTIHPAAEGVHRYRKEK